MENRNILISTGKTGGHIIPAIFVGEKYHNNYPNAKITFTILENSNILEFFPNNVNYADFVKLKDSENLNPKTLILNIIRVLKKMKKNNIKKILIFGSYLSFPVVLAAIFLRSEINLHEQNVLPGRANRFASFFCKKIFISYPESTKYFNAFLRKKIICSGNPTRNFDISCISEKNQILFLGGSQGAKSINEFIISNLDKIKRNPEIKFILISGKKNYKEMKEVIENKGIENLEIISFTEEILNIIANSKLVVSRAGAMTLSEIAMTERPSILIPYPYARDNHQEINARYFEKKQASIVIKNNELKDNFDLIIDLFYSPVKLKEMSKASKSLFIPDASTKIVKQL